MSQDALQLTVEFRAYREVIFRYAEGENGSDTNGFQLA
jgi:hypothetical protein